MDKSRLIYLKSEVAEYCGVHLKTLRRLIQPLIDKGCIRWNNHGVIGKGGKKMITSSDADTIIRFFNEGIMPEPGK